jgi:hypothetical protein
VWNVQGWILICVLLISVWNVCYIVKQTLNFINLLIKIQNFKEVKHLNENLWLLVGNIDYCVLNGMYVVHIRYKCGYFSNFSQGFNSNFLMTIILCAKSIGHPVYFLVFNFSVTWKITELDILIKSSIDLLAEGGKLPSLCTAHYIEPSEPMLSLCYFVRCNQAYVMCVTRNQD